MPVGITAGGKDKSVPPHSVMRLANVLDKMKRPVLLIYRENDGRRGRFEDAKAVIEFAIGAGKATM